VGINFKRRFFFAFLPFIIPPKKRDVRYTPNDSFLQPISFSQDSILTFLWKEKDQTFRLKVNGIATILLFIRNACAIHFSSE